GHDNPAEDRPGDRGGSSARAHRDGTVPLRLVLALDDRDDGAAAQTPDADVQDFRPLAARCAAPHLAAPGVLEGARPARRAAAPGGWPRPRSQPSGIAGDEAVAVAARGGIRVP